MGHHPLLLQGNSLEISDCLCIQHFNRTLKKLQFRRAGGQFCGQLRSQFLKARNLRYSSDSGYVQSREKSKVDGIAAPPQAANTITARN
eukprot:CAMPEP_0180798144 /NCGR_PEP_ID=MMETSP1038_2-20121128/57774_1 /TAXON_ID=632150 /ORGANISM="Azadinium spinosum, Strain 3D9" /LENGTH=88 /DNA_ID=CAMNT_0022837507 /DNA_START=12 /DNA_END=275 /DNA_ORIENTATION=-